MINEFISNLSVVAFVIFLAGYVINSAFILYHLLKFGLDYKTKVLAFIFSAGSIILIILNFQLFSEIQWAELMFRIFEYLNV